MNKFFLIVNLRGEASSPTHSPTYNIITAPPDSDILSIQEIAEHKSSALRAGFSIFSKFHVVNRSPECPIRYIRISFDFSLCNALIFGIGGDTKTLTPLLHLLEIVSPPITCDKNTDVFPYISRRGVALSCKCGGRESGDQIAPRHYNNGGRALNSTGPFSLGLHSEYIIRTIFVKEETGIWRAKRDGS